MNIVDLINKLKQYPEDTEVGIYLKPTGDYVDIEVEKMEYSEPIMEEDYDGEEYLYEEGKLTINIF